MKKPKNQSPYLTSEKLKFPQELLKSLPNKDFLKFKTKDQVDPEDPEDLEDLEDLADLREETVNPNQKVNNGIPKTVNGTLGDLKTVNGTLRDLKMVNGTHGIEDWEAQLHKK